VGHASAAHAGARRWRAVHGSVVDKVALCHVGAGAGAAATL